MSTPIVETNLKFSAREIFEWSVQSLLAGFPFLIVGPGGIGKSDILEQAVSAINTSKLWLTAEFTEPFELLISHPSVKGPQDYQGLPFRALDGTVADFLPFGDLYRMLSATRPLVVFFDDLGQAAVSVQAAIMQLILGREINQKHISPFVRFCAATNRRQDRAGVQNFLDPLATRFDWIAELVPSVEDWVRWAAKNSVRKEVISFLNWDKSALCDSKTSADIAPHACPRTWFHLSRQLTIGAKDLKQFCAVVGAEYGAKFAAHLACYADLPRIEAILKNPKTAPLPVEDGTGSFYAMAGALSSHVNPTNIDKIFVYLNRLPKEIQVLTVKISLKAQQIVKESAVFATWAADNADIFI